MATPRPDFVHTAMPAGATRDPFMPRSMQRNKPALAFAIAAHALLVAALAFSVHWRNDEPTQVAAELWSAVPQAAAPRAVEPPTAPPPTPVEKVVPPPPPAPAPAPAPTPAPAPAPTPPRPDPQIAIEKAKRDEAKRTLAAEEAASQRRAEQQQRLAEKQKADKAKLAQAAAEQTAKEKAERAAKLKADKLAAASDAAAREAQIRRMQKGLMGATGGATDTGNAVRSSGPSANYGGRIVARIKPNILLTDPVDGNPRAVVEVRIAPDGTIIGKRLIESSGSKVWDDAVMRAIERTETLPLDNGVLRSPIELGFRPRD